MILQSIMKKPVDGRAYSGPEPYRKGWPKFRLNDVSAATQIKGESVTVAIVDSGDPNDTSSYRDDDGHANLLAETIRGVEPHPYINVQHIKSFSAQSWPKPDRGAEAVRRAAQDQDPPAVVVLAWDTGHDTPELRDSVLGLRNRSLVVIAAGNWSLDNDKHPNWPASYCGEAEMDHVITVMATNEDDERASYSCYGERSVYIAAPGVAIVKASSWQSVLRKAGSLRDSYTEFRGTSAAAAHVARLAALLKVKNPGWNPQRIKEHISDTGRDISKDLRRRPAELKCCQTNRIVDFGEALK